MARTPTAAYAAERLLGISVHVPPLLLLFHVSVSPSCLSAVTPAFQAATAAVCGAAAKTLKEEAVKGLGVLLMDLAALAEAGASFRAEDLLAKCAELAACLPATSQAAGGFSRQLAGRVRESWLAYVRQPSGKTALVAARAAAELAGNEPGALAMQVRRRRSVWGGAHPAWPGGLCQQGAAI